MMEKPLDGRRVLVTGIANENSLALAVAEKLKTEGAELVCAGLGPTKHQDGLSEAAMSFLKESFSTFQKAVRDRLGEETPCLVFDASEDASIDEMAGELVGSDLQLDGVLHAIAFDRTIRGGEATPLLNVSRKDFLDCMGISAYSLIALMRALHERERLNHSASVVALSYIGAERITSHPYRNIGMAKAALERITRELAAELGNAAAIRVNSLRFSPFAESRAGGAIPKLIESVEDANLRSPLGNATPEALGLEVAHLMRPGVMVTGETRHVDGGYHALA
ncbi:MAG: enoyl-ACP reductase [Myxococcota bacterium]